MLSGVLTNFKLSPSSDVFVLAIAENRVTISNFILPIGNVSLFSFIHPSARIRNSK